MTRRVKEYDQLTKDSIAAWEAGMSYGKYKALHPTTKPKSVKSTIIKGQEKRTLCAICGEPIPKGTHRRKYCGGACADIAYRI